MSALGETSETSQPSPSLGRAGDRGQQAATRPRLCSWGGAGLVAAAPQLQVQAQGSFQGHLRLNVCPPSTHLSRCAFVAFEPSGCPDPQQGQQSGLSGGLEAGVRVRVWSGASGGSAVCTGQGSPEGAQSLNPALQGTEGPTE